MDGSAIHRAAAVFTAAGCIWCGGCAAVGAGDCRFGRGCLLDFLPHILADLRQNLPDLLAELFVIAVLNIGLRIAAGRHAGTHCGRWCDVHRAGVELEAHFVKIGIVDEYSDVKNSYDFYITIFVNNDYFDEIRFKINSDSVDITPPPAMRPGMTTRCNPETNVEYRNCKKLGEEIRQVLTQVRKDVRQQIEQEAAPKTAVTCPYCGATTTPDVNGCCEYCGGAVRG